MDAGSLKVSSIASVLPVRFYILSLCTLYQNSLEMEWTKRSVLPRLRTSLLAPFLSAQKVHAVAAETNNMTVTLPLPVTATSDSSTYSYTSNTRS
jgi:hypothetical protein